MWQISGWRADGQWCMVSIDDGWNAVDNGRGWWLGLFRNKRGNGVINVRCLMLDNLSVLDILRAISTIESAKPSATMGGISKTNHQPGRFTRHETPNHLKQQPFIMKPPGSPTQDDQLSVRCARLSCRCARLSCRCQDLSCLSCLSHKWLAELRMV